MLNEKKIIFFIQFVYKQKLFFKIFNKAGRNNSGKITFFSKGRKHKSNSIFIYTKKFNLSKILNFFSSVNKSGKVALIQTFENFIFFILATDCMKKNDYIIFSYLNEKILKKLNLIKNIGDELRNIKPGLNICNLGFGKKKLNKIACSGGTTAKIISKYSNIARIKLKSGVILELKNYYTAYFGTIQMNNFFNKGNKAGKMYFFGLKPKVRGVAMNPCDHPHGGGEGKKSKKVSPKNPFGHFIKKPTRNKKKNILKYV